MSCKTDNKDCDFKSSCKTIEVGVQITAKLEDGTMAMFQLPPFRLMDDKNDLCLLKDHILSLRAKDLIPDDDSDEYTLNSPFSGK